MRATPTSDLGTPRTRDNGADSHFERNMNDGMTHALLSGKPVMFSMVSLEVVRAIAKGAKNAGRGSPELAKQVFDDATLALEIYDGRFPKLTKELHELGALSAFLRARKIAWEPTCGDDQHHPADMRKRLAKARTKFKKDSAVLAGLSKYEREVRDGLVDEDDDDD